MKQTPTEIALLEDALVAIERVLASGGTAAQGVPYRGPTANVPLEALDDPRARSGAANSALQICLGAAVALVEVGATLMAQSAEQTPEELECEWHALVTHTKSASRSAYRAALIMAAQMGLGGPGLAAVAAADPQVGLAAH